MQQNVVSTFADGPSHVPPKVIENMKKEFFNWNGMGICMLEMGFRNPAYLKHFNEISDLLKQIYGIPQGFSVYYMTSGDYGQYAAIPANLLKFKHNANYLNTGIFSQLAIKEAQIYATGKVNEVAHVKRNEHGQLYVPPQNEWKIEKDAAYLHFVDSDFSNGIALNQLPTRPEGQLLTGCFSSSFLVKEIDWTNIDLAYAEASTFGGSTGVEYVVLRDSLIDGKKHPKTPFMLDYEEYKKSNGMPNTPQNFPVYQTSELFKYIIESGGRSFFIKEQQRKAELIYGVIDKSKGFYWNDIVPENRSKSTAVWHLASRQLEKQFKEEAQSQGMIGFDAFEGESGLRANFFLGVTFDQLKKLTDFMEDFKNKHQ